jgi:REP element-mobilizing transposase RayT
MTSHIHLIVTSSSVPLNQIIRDFKKHTAKQLLKTIKEAPESRREWLLNKFSYASDRNTRGSNYKVWQDGFHPVILDTNKKLKQRVDYIHGNPLNTGLVNEEKNWAHSSFLAYTDT